MSKGIIVIDIPETCGECICCESNPLEDYCRADKNEGHVEWGNSPPVLCSIKPMPERDNKNYFPDEFLDGMAIGWNNCIDVILGGSDG